MSAAWVALAHVLRPQGRKGEVLAELLTDFPERLAGRSNLYLEPEGFAGRAEEARACRIVNSWLPKGRNEGRIVLAIEGVTTIEMAEALSRCDVLVEAEHRLPLEDGAAYVSDLVGCSVYDRGRLVGVVEQVEFPTSADGRRRLEEATPLLLVRLPNGEEAMIPFTTVFLREFDPAAKVLRMELPEGLVEVSAGAERGADEEEREKAER